MDAADEVGEGGVLDEPRQLTAVRSGHELHATLRYAARRQRLCLCANLILTQQKLLSRALAGFVSFCISICSADRVPCPNFKVPIRDAWDHQLNRLRVHIGEMYDKLWRGGNEKALEQLQGAALYSPQ